MNPIGPATAELALLLLLELGAAAAPAAAQTESAARSAGERFFLTGLAADGRAVPAVVQGDLRVTSVEMPCAGCHRRSGWAGNEGTINVAPVAGPALFAPVTRGSREMGALRTSGEGTRPAYTEATLMRAIREGIDPSGRTLAPTMPRYALREADATTLVAHLRSLSATPPPGVTDSEIHVATVVSPGVEAADRQAVHEVMRAFLKDKNAGTRHETRRRERGPWDMKQHYDAYRSWVLHEWELTGPPGGWPAQLETLYQRQPVFALVGGIVEGDASRCTTSPSACGCRRSFPRRRCRPREPRPTASTRSTSRGRRRSRQISWRSASLTAHSVASCRSSAAGGPGRRRRLA
jgi:hypothetical protein